VIGARIRLDQQAFSVLVERDKSLLAPTSSGSPTTHCYHAGRVTHRFRFLLPPETCCESNGSHIHIIHNDLAVASATRIAVRLHIKEAGLRCTGGARDECAVKEIALVLMRQLNMKPNSSHMLSYRLRQLRHVIGPRISWCPDDSFVASMTKAALLDERQRNSSLYSPSSLADGITRTLRSKMNTRAGVIRRDKRGYKIVDALPLTVKSNQQIKKSKAKSTVKSALEKWLYSEEGQVWKQKRDKLIAGKYDDDEASDESCG
jgi:hypothetical protein